MENNSLEGGYSSSNLESPGFNIDFSDPSSVKPPKQPPRRVSFFKAHKYLLISVFSVLLITVLAGVGTFVLGGNTSKNNSQTPVQKINSYAPTNVPVSQVSTTGELELGQANKVTINGQINVNSGLVLSPTSTPTNPVAGQFYFDQTTKQAYYYNGTQFVSVGQSAATASTTNANVSSIQGLNGTVSFSAGSGILLNGTTINNAGVVSLTGANGLQVSSPSGDVTISLPQALDASASPTFSGLTLSGLGENGLLYGGGTSQISTVNTTTPDLCLVSSSSGAPTWSSCLAASISGTVGSIAMYTGSNQLGSSILTQSGTAIQVGGDLDVTGDISGDGSNIINLNASNVASGILPVQYGGTGAIDADDARTNLGAAQSGINADITSLTGLSSITPATALAIGASDEPLYLQGSSGTTIAATDSGYTTTLSFEDPTTTANISLPNNSGTVAVAAQSPLELDSTGTLSCTNCLVSQLGSGGGGVLGVVSVNSQSGDLSLAAGLGLNVVSSNGTITVAANQDISTTASPSFVGLTLNGSLGVGTDTPGYPVDVNGDVNTSGQYLIDGVPICTVGGCTAASGNGSYIENTTTIQSAALAIEGSSTSSPVALIRGANGQNTNMFTVQNFSGTNELDVSGAGYVGIDKAAPAYPLDVNGVINTNSSIDISGVAVCASSNGCTPAAGSNNYIQNSTTTQTGANLNIQSAASPSSPTAIIKQASGQTTDLLDLDNTAGAKLFSVTSTGQGYFAGDLGLNTTSPAYPLDVNGNVNISSGSDYLIAGSDICDSTGCIARGGSGSYIQNSTTLQNGDFAIQNSASTSSTTALIKQSSGQTGYLVDLQNTSGTNVFDVSPSGVAYTSTSLGVGVTSPAYAVDVSGDVNITGDFRINGFAVCTASGCSGSGSSGSYIQNSTTNQSANFSITSAASATKPTAIITQATSQTGDLLDLDSSSSAIVASFSPTGQLRIGGASSYSANLNIGTNTATAAGGIDFGTDTDLYRSANATLKTDGTLDAGAFDEMGADYSSGLILQSNTASSTRSTNLEFVDNESTPQSIGLRKEGNNLVVLDNSGNVQLGFNPSSDAILFGNSLDTSLYRSGSNALTTAGLFTVDGQLTAQGDEVVGGASSTNSTSELEVQNASGTSVLEVDTQHDRVGIDTTSAPVYTLDVNGDVNVASGSVYRIGGVAICQSSGCVPGPDSSYYIQNGITTQSANFNISSASTNVASPTAVIEQATNQTGDLLDLENASGGVASSFNSSGQVALDNATSYSGALTIGTSSDTTAADAISFGGDTDLYRSADGSLSLQGTTSTVSLQAANVSGTSQLGTNLDIASGEGTGSAGGGNINLQVSAPADGFTNLFTDSNTGDNVRGLVTDGTYLYWNNFSGSGAGYISQALLNGTSINDTYINAGSTAGLKGITTDGTYIYWVNSSPSPATIGRALLNGTGVNDNFITLPGGDSNVALTTDGTYLYWTNFNTSTVGRALLNGTNVNNSFITTSANPYGLTSDGTYLYWGNLGNETIGRALLNGNSVNNTFITGANNVTYLTNDGTYLYWGGNETVSRALLNGTNVNINFASLNTAMGGLMYYSGNLYIAPSSSANPFGTINLEATTQDTQTTVATVNGSNGSATFENDLNSTSAFQIQNASGSDLFNADTFDSAVDIVSGTTASPTNGEVLYVGKTDSNASTSASEYGAYFISTFNPQSASTAFYYGIDGVTTSSSNYVGSAGVVGESIGGSYTGTGSLGTAIGLYADATNSSTGTITSAYGLQTIVQNGSTGTITKGYGLQVRTPVNDGTISTEYGVYIQAQAGTGITNAYGIYQAGTSDINDLFGITNLSNSTGGTPVLSVTHTNTGTLSDSGASFTVTSSPASADTQNQNGIYSGLTVTNNNDTSANISVRAQADYSGTSGTLTSLDGIQGDARNDSTGTITGAIGVNGITRNLGAGTIQSAMGVQGAINNTGSGTITSSTDLLASSPTNNGGGTITNQYGLYIQPQASTGITNSYGIYQAGTSDINDLFGITNLGTGTQSNGSILSVAKTDTATLSGSSSVVQIGGTFTPSATSTATYRGLYVNPALSGSQTVSGANLYAISANPSYVGTATLNLLSGFSSGATNASTGTVTTASAIQGGIFNGSTGTITSAADFSANSPVNGGGGTITNEYGLYIQAQAGTGITNAYGIYQAGTSDANVFDAATDTFKTGTNSTTAFQIQNASGVDDLYVDTTHNTVTVGSSWSGYSGALDIKSIASATVGVMIQSHTSQSADLEQFQDSNGDVLSGVSSNGSIYTNGENITINALAVPAFTTTSTGTSYYYEITAYNAQGQTVASASLGMANDTSALAWSQVAGATGYYIYRNTTNSFTTGSLLLTTITNGATVIYTDTGSATITGLPPTSVVGTGLTIQGWSAGGGNTQTADELNIENASGTSVLTVAANGITTIRTSGGVYGGSLNVGTVGSTSVGVIIRGVSSQTGDLQEFQNSSGTILSEFTASGSLQGGNASGSNAAGTNLVLAGGEGTGTGAGGNINFNIYAPGTTGSTNNTTPSTALSLNGSTGAATFQNATNSGGAFQVQNSAGSSVLTVATTLLNQPAAPTLTSSSTGGTFAAGTYYYELSAINANGATMPVASSPASVTTTGTTSTNTLTWSAVSGATAYIVYRSSNGGSTWSSYETTSTSLTDTNVYFSPTTLPTSDQSAGYLNVNGVYKLNGANVLQDSGYTLFVGNSGNSTTTGYANTAVGQQSLAAITSGTNNAALGTNSLQADTTGSSNTAIGINSLGGNTVGGANTALGSSALHSNSSGSNNTGVGGSSLYYTTGSYNIGLGYNAGVTSNSSNAATSGSYDEYLGYNTGDTSATQLQNSTAIGAFATVNENNALVLGCVNGVNGCTANTEVGIDNSTPANLLSIGALTTAAGTYQIAVSTGGTTNSGIVVQTVASQSSGYVFQAQSSTGSTLASIDYQGNLSVQSATVSGNLTVDGHYISGGSVPTIVSGVAGGSGAAVSISGDDTLGTITITTGTTTSTAGILATITFANSYGSAPKVIISPSNAVSAGSYYYAGTTNTTSFQIDVNAIPSPGTTYTFDYFTGQ
jgi:hypothetical protein